MANFANPTVGSNYTDFPVEIRASVDAALQQLSVGSHTNIPTGAIKFDTSANRWKKFNGSAFVDLTSTYDLNADVSVNQLDLGTNEKVRLGASQELEIYNDNTRSRIESSDHLFIKGGDITFFKANSSEQFIDCNFPKRYDTQDVELNMGILKGDRMPFVDFMKVLASYNFAISPTGNGLDTFRTWECRYRC